MSEVISEERKAQLLAGRRVVIARIKEMSRPLWFEFFSSLRPDEIQMMVDETDVEGDLLLPRTGVSFEVARNVWSGKTKPWVVTHTATHAGIAAEGSVNK